LVGGALDAGTAVVYGFFIYGGFGIWTLSVKVVRGNRIGILAIAFQFFYSFMMTVLWATVLLKLQSFVADEKAFKVALNVALAAIFIQLVFGPVYRNVWARALSDEWILASPEYVILATVVCAGSAALPQDWPKPWWVCMVIIFCIFGPAMLLRRSLMAYVLLRVQPGRTEHVRKKLTAANLSSSVLYGDYDVLVKLEVAGRPAFFSKNASNDERELAELAALVHKEIRCMEGGVTETQTLLDFSDFVSLPPREEEQVNQGSLS
jgi:hypothetical protein